MCTYLTTTLLRCLHVQRGLHIYRGLHVQICFHIHRDLHVHRGFHVQRFLSECPESAEGSTSYEGPASVKCSMPPECFTPLEGSRPHPENPHHLRAPCGVLRVPRLVLGGSTPHSECSTPYPEGSTSCPEGILPLTEGSTTTVVPEVLESSLVSASATVSLVHYHRPSTGLGATCWTASQMPT